MPVLPEDAAAWLHSVGRERLALPLIVAPMFEVSGPALASAACRSGVIGTLPAHNARSTAELGDWLARLSDEGAMAMTAAPLALNLLVHQTNRRLDADLACVVDHGVELVIASVGSPAPIVEGLHAAGVRVLADVASMRHVKRALDLGVDGLILLTAGAGGQTGWANPLAFVRAVRELFDGPIVLAGGISDGAALWAAIAAGCNLAYMGTRFIVARESEADDGYRAMAIAAGLDDVTTTTQLTGIPANVLTASLTNARSGNGRAAGHFAHDNLAANAGRARGAGHTVHAVRETLDCAEIVDRVRAELRTARERTNAISEELCPSEPEGRAAAQPPGRMSPAS